MKTTFLSLSAAILVAAPAFAATPITFERDGVAYVATVDQKDGVETIEGHEVQSGRAFALRVVNGQVTGTYDRMPVSYDAPRAKLAKVAKPDQLASR